MTPSTLQDLTESVDFEAKLARGRDGQGEVPRSLWETYSAFANTNGGVILLGVEDKGDQLRPVGLDNPQRLIDQFWNDVNNKSCVSANLLRDQDVTIESVDGCLLVQVRVPRAPRSARPVYVGANPLDGTFRRRGSADQKCSPEEVRRMLAEQVETSRDERICVGLHPEDLSEPTLRRYRQRYQAHQPGHAWNSLDDREFLRAIGAWRRDRESSQAGVTLAGLLMFGHLVDIIDEFPNYFLDYQERAEARTELRWVDRVCTDGSWSGNLYDFYTTVIAKLGEGLGGPWQLRGDQRIDDSRLHEALREALVNALIHADFTGRTSVLVVKRPDLFGFRNPGCFRVPLEEARRGGDSDCRNRRLQAMFRYVGFGDQAGSGMPKILEAWRGLNWRLPRWSETPGANEQTQLELPRASLLAAPVVAALRERHGLEFDKLALTDRLALALAVEEGEVTHTRVVQMAGAHSRDATLALNRLVQRGLLVAVDRRRPVTYVVPDGALTRRNHDLFEGIDATVATAGGSDLREKAATLVADPLIMQAEAVTLNDKRATLNDGAVTLVAEPLILQAEAVILNDRPATLNDRAATLNDRAATLNEASAAVSVDRQSNPGRQRASDTERLSAAIVAACATGWLTVDQIAVAVGRSVTYVRNTYLPTLVAAGRLEQRFAGKARHRGQAYRAATLSGGRGTE